MKSPATLTTFRYCRDINTQETTILNPVFTKKMNQTTIFRATQTLTTTRQSLCQDTTLSASSAFLPKPTAKPAKPSTVEKKKTASRLCQIAAKPARLRLMSFSLDATLGALKEEVAKEKTDRSSISDRPFIENLPQKD